MGIDEIIEELERTKDYPASEPASDEALDSAITIIRQYRRMRLALVQGDNAMTRVEQIDWLCRLRAYLNDGCIITPWNKQFTEALDGIISNL